MYCVSSVCVWIHSSRSSLLDRRVSSVPRTHSPSPQFGYLSHSPIRKTASVVYPHIADLLCTIYMDIYYTTMPVFLQISF